MLHVIEYFSKSLDCRTFYACPRIISQSIRRYNLTQLIRPAWSLNPCRSLQPGSAYRDATNSDSGAGERSSGRKSRFFMPPAGPAFDAPVRGSPSEYCNNVRSGKTGMVELPDSEKFENVFNRFDTIPARDRRTTCHSIIRAYAGHRAVKSQCSVQANDMRIPVGLLKQRTVIDGVDQHRLWSCFYTLQSIVKNSLVKLIVSAVFLRLCKQQSLPCIMWLYCI